MKSWCTLLVLAAQTLASATAVTSAMAADSAQPSTPMSTVNGTIHFAAQKAAMAHLYYVRRTSDNVPVTALLFSSHPLPLGALEDRQKLLQLARNGAFLGLYAEINREGELSQSELLYNEGAFSGPWRFEPAKGKAAGIAGRIAMDEPREFFGKDYMVDLTFKTSGKPGETWSGSPFLQTKATGLAVGQAKGWMERLGRKTEFTHAIAVIERNLFGDADERSVLLSTKAVTDVMFDAPGGPEKALYDAGATFLRVRINAKGGLESMSALATDGNVMSFSGNQWNVDLVKTPADEVEGYLEALEERDANSEFPRFQLQFHAGIRTSGSDGPVTAENGRALPKDGGEPGRAFRAFAQALQKAKSIEELLPLRIKLLKGELDAIPPAERPAMLSFLKEQGKTPLKITGGFANDSQATLWLEGRDGDMRVNGRVNVHREDGAWKLGAESYRISDANK